MRTVSREATAAAHERLDALLADRSVDAWQAGEELFAVTGALTSSAGVRRALTDASRDGQARAGLVSRLFGPHVSEGVLDLLSGMVRGRWSAPADLTEAVEALGVDAFLASAERNGRLDGVEDELFRFGRIAGADPGLRDAFSARAEGADRKEALVRSLLEGKAAPETVRLAVQAVLAPRGLRPEHVLESYVEAAARRRHQLVAHVTAAVPLTEEQRTRLGEALARSQGRPVQLNIDVDPDLVGGLRVELGGEVIDGTVASRLDEARRRLAG